MPFYTDSDSVAPRIPALGLPGQDIALGGFIHFGQVVIAAGDDTGNSSDVHGPMPDTAPAATSDTDADILFDSQETLDILRVEATAAEPVWLVKLGANVVTAWTAAVTLTIGDTNDAQGWITSAGLTATTTDLGGLAGDSESTANNGGYNVSGMGRIWAASSGHVGVVIGGANPTAGRLAVCVAYANIFRAAS